MTSTILVEETTSPAREGLRAAALELRTAEKKAADAQDAAARASAGVEIARERVASFKALDAECDAFRVAAVREGRSAALPSELRQRQHRQGEASAELEAALHVSKTLGAEGITALRELERAQERLRSAAAAAVFETAAGFASELKELDERRDHLRTMLRALLDSLPAGANFEARQMVDRALGHEPRALPANQSPLADARSFWQRQVARLVANPEAEIAELPTARSLWGY